MKISAKLIDSTILVKKQKDVGRLYNKSHFGKTITGNRLQLDLLEGTFLLGEEKILLSYNKKEMDFQSFIKIAAKKIPEFEIKYLVFRDLRKRGHVIKLDEENKNIHFYIHKQKNNGKDVDKQCFITAFSERDVLNIDSAKRLIQTVTKKDGVLWFAIVDEEGDITYYDVDLIDLKGKIKNHKFPKGTSILLKNRIVLFDKQLTKNLHQKEFFGKPFGDGLQLSLIEALYLIGIGVLDIQKVGDKKKLSKKEFMELVKHKQPDIKSRLLVFKDLKKRGLIVKTGFKFGTHFRAYARDPDKVHAEYLVHVVHKGFESIWAEISRAVRLAHSVNKEIIFARVDGKSIDYIKFGRLRP